MNARKQVLLEVIVYSKVLSKIGDMVKEVEIFLLIWYGMTRM